MSIYSVLNTLSEYTYLFISKNIASYTFLLVFKSSKTFSVSLNPEKGHFVCIDKETDDAESLNFNYFAINNVKNLKF